MANVIDAGVIEMGRQALSELEGATWVGLVVGSEANHFSAGEDLAGILAAAEQGQWDTLRENVKALQNLNRSFRFSGKPVIAAIRGRTLGAGIEIAMHCARIVAAAETKIGLVEMGVGLIPAGGAIKEMARRVIAIPMSRAPGAPPFPFLQRAFDTIAQAKVASTAYEARAFGFLAEDDIIVSDPAFVLATAKREALTLAAGYQAPALGNTVYAAGRPGRALLEVGIQQLEWGGFVTEYDAVVGRAIADVLAGGDFSDGQWVTEEHVLALEQEAFLSLARNKQTRDRIQAMLTTGKPLRN